MAGVPVSRRSSWLVHRMLKAWGTGAICCCGVQKELENRKRVPPSHFCLPVSCWWLPLAEFNKQPVARESGTCGLQTSSSSITEQNTKGWAWAERQLVSHLP